MCECNCAVATCNVPTDLNSNGTSTCEKTLVNGTLNENIQIHCAAGSKLTTVVFSESVANVTGFVKFVSAISVTSISAPHLQTSNGLVITTRPDLESSPLSLDSLDLSSYSGSTDNVLIMNCPNLLEVSFPKLAQTDGDFAVKSCVKLKTISAPLLTSAAHLEIKNNLNALTTLQLPALSSLTQATFQHLAVLSALDLPALKTVTGYFYISHSPDNDEKNTALESVSLPEFTSGDSLLLETNPALKTLDLPKLVNLTGYFKTVFNDAITSITAPELTYVGILIHANNAKLSEVYHPKLVENPTASEGSDKCRVVRGEDVDLNFTVPHKDYIIDDWVQNCSAGLETVNVVYSELYPPPPSPPPSPPSSSDVTVRCRPRVAAATSPTKKSIGRVTGYRRASVALANRLDMTYAHVPATYGVGSIASARPRGSGGDGASGVRLARRPRTSWLCSNRTS